VHCLVYTMGDMDTLIPVPEFLKRAKRENMILTRRGLQLYFSDELRLLPKPTHKGGYVSHMPLEALETLRVVFALNNIYGLPLPKIRAAMDLLDEKVFPLVIKGLLPPLFLGVLLGKQFSNFLPGRKGEKIGLKSVRKALVGIIADCDKLEAAKG